MNCCFRLAVAVTVVLFSTAAGPPPPAAIEEKNVIAGKARLDPTRGYIYLHSTTRLFGTFLRLPDDAQKAEYQGEWEEAFAKEQRRYPDRLKRWESLKKAETPTSQIGPRPIEPVRETFAIAPIELKNMVAFGPAYVYRKTDDYFGYLTSLLPGTYVWYGQMFAAESGGFVGTCYCMGTVKFEVKPGVVTDLGNFTVVGPVGEKTHDVATLEAWRLAEARAAKTGKPAEALPPQQVSFGLPDSLKAWPTVQAEFSAYGKSNNFYGISISRLPPVKGVLAYRRDTVIDVRTNTELPNPLLMSRAKMPR